jgi:N utilization substance protein B
MDAILMKMAICEFLKFPSIPVKVTINEYLEIAKEYSTNKSSTFINGILDSLVKDFKNEEKLQKIGRGLM